MENNNILYINGIVFLLYMNYLKKKNNLKNSIFTFYSITNLHKNPFKCFKIKIKKLSYFSINDSLTILSQIKCNLII